MASLEYEVVDVFTAAPFAGNPLAVVLGADGLDQRPGVPPVDERVEGPVQCLQEPDVEEPEDGDHRQRGARGQCHEPAGPDQAPGHRHDERQEDEELQASRSREDEERQKKLDGDMDAAEDETELEMDAVEEQARRNIEDGEKRIRELEEKRRVSRFSLYLCVSY